MLAQSPASPRRPHTWRRSRPGSYRCGQARTASRRLRARHERPCGAARTRRGSTDSLAAHHTNQS
eukprot:scaffold81645_cov69-Phaeocystis_antarctica.AAC.1